MKLVFGKGYNDLGESVTEKGSSKMFYRKWVAMLRRCYSGKQPAYNNTVVCKEWLALSNFKSWFEENYIEDFDLDKDLFGDGTLYSPETCCFLPVALNILLEKSPCGEFPRGVNYNRVKNRYAAKCRVYGKKVHIGSFATPEEASVAYIEFKQKHVKVLTKAYLLDGLISQEVYDNINRRF